MVLGLFEYEYRVIGCNIARIVVAILRSEMSVKGVALDVSLISKVVFISVRW